MTTVVLVMLSSCDKGVGTSSSTSLAVSPREINTAESQISATVHTEGRWTLKLVSDVDAVTWARVSASSGEGDAVVDIIVSANEENAARSCNVILECAGKTYIKAFIQDGHKQEPKWLELPLTPKSDNMTFYSHDMMVNGSRSRNYSFWLDKKARISRWVAYPLNRSFIGSGERENAWGVADPKAPSSDYPYVGQSFSGYDRGHQLPSADRYAANESTYYGTNITPQRSRFNQGIWVTMEALTRSWSMSFDTLYVVTGADYPRNFEVIKDRAGKEIAVPSAYYKVLLGYKKSGTVGNTSRMGGYTAVAFYLDHKLEVDESEYYSTIMANKKTVDQIEEILGIDFFPNLIRQTAKASAVESTMDAWWK